MGMKYNLQHSVAACKKLGITIPSTVDKKTLRVDDKGSTYAKNIYSKDYDNLADAFTKIANYCETALKNSAICSQGVKTELTQAKKKANNQASACKNKAKEIKTQYHLTEDIYYSMNK